MLRLPFLRAIPPVSRALGVRSNSTGAPEKVEVFVDDQKVLVDPGTTVLQVNYLYIYIFRSINFSSSRLQQWWELKSRVFAIMNDSQWLATAECVWLKLRNLPRYPDF